jgi:hypothetical protein
LPSPRGHTGSILVSGDEAIRAIATKHHLEVHGVLWVVDEIAPMPSVRSPVNALKLRSREVAESVVQGYFNYHAVPGNMDSLNSFRAQVIWRWYRALRRRSQRGKTTWERFWPLVDRWIPSAKILHPHPNVRFDATHPR